ncbi:E3 SUMO-protein ligase PIAS4 [Indicator indicator]|uniref:E3 SUMO-protein ligase PIAS4 n=1 Tax=Indicator indicator TaxID=1002788 RepID=UPI0023DF46D4|nr:E3 SUMO-protein ligase PIAS4 [Indicator indicator]
MAAELVEAKNMVMSFRVSDLQMLLGFVGRSKSGLKHELVTRALQLVQFDCSPEVFKKIKELYETRYAKKSSEVAQPQPQQHRSPDALSIHSSYDRGSAVARTSISTTNIDYPTLYGKYLNGLGRLPPKVAKPEVRLVKLPFYTTLDELLKPTELVPQNNEKLQESPCIFALTPRQVELIRNSRELQPGVKSVQVVLRICYTDTSSPQEDQYPPNIAVKVNHSYCSVPGYYPSNKPGVEPKRPCRPINLTHLMYLSAATNRITVTWGNYGKPYLCHAVAAPPSPTTTTVKNHMKFHTRAAALSVRELLQDFRSVRTHLAQATFKKKMDATEIPSRRGRKTPGEGWRSSASYPDGDRRRWKFSKLEERVRNQRTTTLQGTGQEEQQQQQHFEEKFKTTKSQD